METIAHANQILEWWDQPDAFYEYNGNDPGPRPIAPTDELCAFLYHQQLDQGQAPCLCSHEARHHNFGKGGLKDSWCHLCYEGNRGGVPVGCDRFAPSPFYCPVCSMPTATAAEALSCCICALCVHVFDKHLKRTPASNVAEPSACQARFCGCAGFGGAVAA